MTRIRIFVIASTIGCGPVVDFDTADDTTGAVTDTPMPMPTTSTGPIATTSTGASTTAGVTTSVESTDGGGDVSTSADAGDDCVFISGHDVGCSTVECDIWIDDCPPDQKCMPWANDGGSSWNAVQCSPLAEELNQVGEPCTVEGSGVSGIDDCAARSMCWDVDPETNMGVCVGFCTGSEANPTCGDPCTSCAIGNEGVLILCLPTCDPIVQDCAEGQGCYPWGEMFGCVPDSGAEMGAMGDACEFVNVCDPGLFCGAPELVPGCVGAVGCCTPFCDLNAVDPCPVVLEGVECVPWFEDGAAPPCFAQVIGGCLLPE